MEIGGKPIDFGFHLTPGSWKAWNAGVDLPLQR